jgi:ATP-dependent Clp protease ATP-binding subunit ClpB
MMDYSRFTPNARSAIQKAHSIALSCSYVEVTPSIQMVGIIQEARDMVFFLLQQMEVDKVAFCQSVSDILATVEQHQNCQPDNSDALTQILQKSIQLASESESSLAGVEHIFWAYAKVRNELSGVFRQYNMTERKVIQAVQTYRNGNMENPSETAEIQGSPSSLSKFARNLNALASDGIIEPSIGRDEEVRRILQILSRKTKNNPILVGEPGTGKTAIVEGIAHRIVRGDVPQDMLGLKIFTLDLSLLIAGASMQGEFEDRLKSIIEEAKADKNIVLFIDEIHLLIGAGRTSGAMDAANIIKPELARGEIRVIGATTFEEYRKYIESDKAFARRLQKITINEPDEEASIAILRGIKSRFESHHRIKILDEAVVASVKLSIRYITDRFLPDKAIDLLDEAASKMRMERSSVPEALDNLTRTIRCKEIEKQSILQDGLSNGQQLELLDLEIAELREKENTLNAKWRNERQEFELIQTLQDELERYKINREQEESLNRFEQAALLQRRIDEVESRIDELIHEFSEENNPLLKMSLDENDIRKVITIWTGIPVEELGKDEVDQLLRLEANLQSSVIGQNEAIHSVANIVRRNRMGFSNSNKPIGSFLFLGTTGVGKTELAKSLAQYLFHSQDLIIRIDMSEYQQEHSVSRLFGAPPGYVGYDQGGQLTEAVRRKPYSVILLDEIEKAHSKVFETLLQVLDDGRMTDGQGHVVDFKNTIIIMTSNLGATFIAEHIGDDSFSETKPVLIQQIVQLLKQKVSSEFVNRIDEFLLFNPLTKDAIRKISILQLTRLIEKLSKNGINIIIDDDVINYIVESGFDPEMGARPIKRVIDKLIVDPLAENVLSSRISKDKQIIISYLNNGLVFHN